MYKKKSHIFKYSIDGSIESLLEFIPIRIQQDETLHSLFMSGNCSSSFQTLINCVTLHLVGYVLEYTSDTRNPER